MTTMLSRLAVAMVALAAAAPLACAVEDLHATPEITVEDAAKKLAEKNVYVYDCNPKDVYAAGHVPHAKWVDYSKLTDKDLPSDKSATLIFYCANEH